MRARKRPNVMERGSVPCFSVFFRPNHESASVALLQSRSSTPIHGVISRDLRAPSRFRLRKFARVQRVISETSGHIRIRPVSPRPWGQHTLEDRGVSITLGTSNTENL